MSADTYGYRMQKPFLNLMHTLPSCLSMSGFWHSHSFGICQRKEKRVCEFHIQPFPSCQGHSTDTIFFISSECQRTLQLASDQGVVTRDSPGEVLGLVSSPSATQRSRSSPGSCRFSGCSPSAGSLLSLSNRTDARRAARKKTRIMGPSTAVRMHTEPGCLEQRLLHTKAHRHSTMHFSLLQYRIFPWRLWKMV